MHLLLWFATRPFYRLRAAYDLLLIAAATAGTSLTGWSSRRRHEGTTRTVCFPRTTSLPRYEACCVDGDGGNDDGGDGDGDVNSIFHVLDSLCVESKPFGMLLTNPVNFDFSPSILSTCVSDASPPLSSSHSNPRRCSHAPRVDRLFPTLIFFSCLALSHHCGNRTSTQTINLLRAFSSGGYADINKLNAWNMDFVQNTKQGSKYRQMASKIEDTLRFMTVSFSFSPQQFSIGKH